MAARNGERFIGEALASLRRQTHPLHELVVVDDASTDSTPALLEAERDDAPYPVTLLRNDERLGAARSFERALGAVTGDIALNCDHDDISEPARAAAAAELLGPDTSPGAVFTDACVIDADGRQHGMLWERSGVASLGPTLHDPAALGPVLIRRGVAWGATMALDVRLVPLLRPFPRWAFDHWIAVVANAMARLVADPRPVLRYRLHSQNLMGVQPRNPVRALRYMRARPEFFVRDRLFFDELTVHLRRHDADERIVAAAEAKADHLAVRTSRSTRLLPRMGQVGREIARGGYRRYSPGLRSALFDMLVTPTVSPSLDPGPPGR